MTKEQEFADIFLADATLSAILTGGVYTEEQIGVEGFRRGDSSPTAAAFDADGFLLPCAAISERGVNPVGTVRSPRDQFVAVSQVVEVYLYQNRGHDLIDAAKVRIFELLEGRIVGQSYEVMWESETRPYYDMGPVRNSTVVVQEWRVVQIRKAA